jgi:hypothetical protein
MSSIQTIITVNKPIKKTFDSFLDENFMAQWVSGFQKIEIIRGEPKQQHSKYILTIDFDGKLTAVTQEIVEIIDQQFLYIRMEHPDIITYSEISFSPTAIDSTKVHCLSKVMGKGFKIKMLMPVVKNILDSRQQRDYKTFRELLEVNAA